MDMSMQSLVVDCDFKELSMEMQQGEFWENCLSLPW